MSAKLEMCLATSRSGRVILHVLVMATSGHFKTHFRGIRREFKKGPAKQQAALMA